MAKFCFFFLLAFIVQNTISQEYWQKQPSPANAWLRKCAYTDSLNVWAAGDSGIVIKTSNGGLNWNRQNSGIMFSIEDIMFINPNRGWAVANNYIGLGAIILSTSNGGVNWAHITYPDSSAIFYSINFLDSLNGWITGYDGLFLNTTNAGTTWIRTPSDSTITAHLPVMRTLFNNRRIGFACGGFRDLSGVIWKTSNYGNNWKSTPIGGEPMYDIASVDSLNIFAVGGDLEFGGSIIKTTDGGDNWSFSFLNIFGTGYSMAFRTRQEAWIAMGFSQQFIYSLDSAATWNKSPVFDSSAVYDVIFPDSRHGYAVGTNGLILKYNINAIGITPNQQTLPASFSLSQNFPNPFNGTTTIEFYLPKKMPVNIRVFDVSGRQVKILQSTTLTPGIHRIRMDSNELASGIYFYRIETSEFQECRKMVLLK